MQPARKPDAEMTDTSPATMDRNLALELVRVTEAAALSASLLMGRGDEKQERFEHRPTLTDRRSRHNLRVIKLAFGYDEGREKRTTSS